MDLDRESNARTPRDGGSGSDSRAEAEAEKERDRSDPRASARALEDCRRADDEADDAHEEAADVERARDGDSAAFERLYRRTVARVHTLARRLVGAGSADEATQEIYVRAWGKLP